MNATEFNLWFADAKTCWPSLALWITKCFPDANSQREFLRKWSGVMSDVRIDMALEVNRLVQSGDLPFVGEYEGDKERLPQHVRRLARQLAFEKRETYSEEPTDVKPSSFPAGKILRRLIELIDGGMSREDAKAMALKDFPIGRPKYEPRYNCALCLDVGRVFVASNTAIRAMLADAFDRCIHRESVVLCKCRSHLARPQRYPLAVYDAAACFKVNESLFHCKPEIDCFREWCEAKREEFWNSKRESAFDHFNQRELA